MRIIILLIFLVIYLFEAKSQNEADDLADKIIEEIKVIANI